MSRWFDCPICIGYCEECICPTTGSSSCPCCGLIVDFEVANEALKAQLYKAGLWCEDVAVVLDDDGDKQYSPAFNTQAEYNRYITFNAVRMGAAFDQVAALLSDDTDDGIPLFTVGKYTICVATDDEIERLPWPSGRVIAEYEGSGSVSFVRHGERYAILDQGIAAIIGACEKGEAIGLGLSKNGTWIAVLFVVGRVD